MGEKKKEEEGKVEKEAEAQKKEEEEAQEIVLKVDMHCAACARKVARSLKGFPGVEEVKADYKTSKVVVKGKKAVAVADPLKLSQRLQNKSGRKVEILSPLPMSLPSHPNANIADVTKNNNNRNMNIITRPQIKEEEPNKDKKKEEPPAVVTVVLKVGMHCEACAHALQKRIGKVKGVESVTTDVGNDNVTVKGVLDPDKLVADIYKKTGKQASIVKGEEKKEDEERKEEEKTGEKQEEKKQAEGNKEEDDKKTEVNKMEYTSPRYYMEHAYAPQMFSDENPNACSVM